MAMNGFRAVCVVWFVASGAAALSAQPAAVDRGRTIAQMWCIACHAIGEGNQPSALSGAPPFKTLAARDTFGIDTLRIALLTPHPVMPEFPVTRADVEALAAYIMSLKEERATQLSRPLVILASDRQAAPARGADEAQRAAGLALVQRDCSPCHAISGAGPSPVSDAPLFSTLSERYDVEYLAEALAEGIMVNHPTVEMPQFVYEPHEISAILAHLHAVQGSGAR